MEINKSLAIPPMPALLIHRGFSVLMAILFAFLMAAVFSAKAQGGPKPEFVWDVSQPFKGFDRVKFANGDFIQVAEGGVPGQAVKEECEYKRLEVRSGPTEKILYIADACDSLVHIEAAYPDSKNAKLAIVTTNCGGTMCGNWSDHFVVFLGDSGVRVTRIGTSYIGPKNKSTKYEFGFNGPRLNWSNITNFYDGSKNSLGDLVPSSRMFIRQGQYIDRKFDKKYLKFVGEHPEEVLGDAEVRANIVEKIKPERFRKFRTAMSGPGSSFILNGRFLVMDACMKSNCPYQFGSVVLDGFTGALHAIRFNLDENLVDHVSSRPLDAVLDATWLGNVDTQNKYSLSIESGRILAIKNRAK